MINLNFLPFQDQNFATTVFRRPHVENTATDSFCYTFRSEDGSQQLYEVKFEEESGFEKFEITGYGFIPLIAKSIYCRLFASLDKSKILIKRKSDIQNKKFIS